MADSMSVYNEWPFVGCGVQMVVQAPQIEDPVHYVAMRAMERSGLQFPPPALPFVQQQFPQYSPYGQPPVLPFVQQQFLQYSPYGQPPAPLPVQQQFQQYSPYGQPQFQPPALPFVQPLADLPQGFEDFTSNGCKISVFSDGEIVGQKEIDPASGEKKLAKYVFSKDTVALVFEILDNSDPIRLARLHLLAKCVLFKRDVMAKLPSRNTDRKDNHLLSNNNNVCALILFLTIGSKDWSCRADLDAFECLLKSSAVDGYDKEFLLELKRKFKDLNNPDNVSRGYFIDKIIDFCGDNIYITESGKYEGILPNSLRLNEETIQVARVRNGPLGPSSVERFIFTIDVLVHALNILSNQDASVIRDCHWVAIKHFKLGKMRNRAKIKVTFPKDTWQQIRGFYHNSLWQALILFLTETVDGGISWSNFSHIKSFIEAELQSNSELMEALQKFTNKHFPS